VVLNAVVPVILYKVSKRYYSPSEFAALVMAALFPLGKGTFDLIRHRRLDPIAVVVLLGITTDGVALLFGGSPGLLLVRESMFTRSEEHTSELQSRGHLVCRLLLEKKKKY